ncbi:hypothetical protein PG2022B_1908 [Bifidobacterium animalis subsp. animalis]|nr:hypothetical protein PG2022B_1908 [Bifidobacterium animalis subsp. animalis]
MKTTGNLLSQYFKRTWVKVLYVLVGIALIWDVVSFMASDHHGSHFLIVAAVAALLIADCAWYIIRKRVSSQTTDRQA